MQIRGVPLLLRLIFADEFLSGCGPYLRRIIHLDSPCDTLRSQDSRSLIAAGFLYVSIALGKSVDDSGTGSG